MKFLFSIVAMILVGCAQRATHFSSKTFIQDVLFITQQIKENHPGAFTKIDPDFLPHLEAETQKAILGLGKAKNTSEAQHIISSFIKSFNDNHLRITWTSESEMNTNKKSFSPEFHLTQEGDITWVALPTFHFFAPDNVSFQSLLKSLPQQRHQKAIAFDLRGNGGGNSENGEDIVSALFGKSYAEFIHRKVWSQSQVAWRASRDNVTYIENLADKYPTFKELLPHLKKSLNKGAAFYISPAGTCWRYPTPQHHVKAHIFLLIDRRNGSAVLDFIDLFKMMDHPVTLIGETTLGDRLYMEVRSVCLPSGLGMLIFPIKVYMKRLRADNEPYKPDIPVSLTGPNREQKIRRLIHEKLIKLPSM